jgi:hypothetical protein
VFEDDEASVQRSDVAHDIIPVLQNLGRCDGSCMDIVIWKDALGREKLIRTGHRTSSIKCCSCTDAGPHDRRQTHCQGDSSNPVINVTERGPHCVGRDTQDILDYFLTPSKFCNNLLVGEGRKGRGMTPSMDGDVVLAQILCLKNSREGNCTRTNDKEGRLERILVEVIQEVGRVVRRSIIVRETPCVLCGAIRDVSVTNTPATRPPTASRVGGSLCIIWAPSRLSNANVWN